MTAGKLPRAESRSNYYALLREADVVGFHVTLTPEFRPSGCGGLAADEHVRGA